MISKPAAAAGAWLSFGLLCGISSLAFGQQNPALISTGTRSGVRLYYPDSNDWWLDPSAGRLDIRVNGGAAPLATFLSGGNVGIGTPAPGFPLHVSVGAAGFIAGFINSNGNGGLRFKVNDASDSLGLGAPWRHAIWGSSSESLALVTNNSTAMVIDNSGKVGIGTAGPSMLLDVYGVNQRMRIGDGTNTLTVGQWDGVTNRIESANRGLRLTTYAGALDLGHSGNPELTVASGGNVGIGTTNPTAALTVNAAADSTPRAYLIGPGSGDASVAQIVRGNGSHKGSGLYISGANYTNGASPATQAFVELNAGPYAGANANFITAYDNSGTDFFIRGDGLGYFRGNVGIGTTSPAAQLQLTNVMQVQGPNVPTYPASGAGLELAYDADLNTTGTGIVQAYDRTGLSSRPLLLNANGGNVGIGTQNPGALLDVYNGVLRVGDGTRNFQAYGSLSQNVVYAGASSNHDLALTTNNAERMRVAASGSVGIGTTNPAVTLHVDLSESATYAGSPTASGLGAGRTIRASNLTGGINTAAGYEFYDNNGFSYIKAVSQSLGNNDIVFGTGNSRFEMMRITSAGNTGIGTTSPAAKLEVAGGVKAGNDADTCTPAKAGTIMWDGARFKGCDGATWTVFSFTASPDGSTSAKAGKNCKDIKINYPSSASGTYWIAPTLGVSAYQVYCNMTTDGGGWTLVMKVASLLTSEGEISKASLASNSVTANAKLSDTDLKYLANPMGQQEWMITNGSTIYIARYSSANWPNWNTDGAANMPYDAKSSAGAWVSNACNGHYNHRGFSSYSDWNGAPCPTAYSGGAVYFTNYHVTYGTSFGEPFTVFVR